MKNILVHLFCRDSVECADYVVCTVRIGCDKTVIAKLVINIFLICFDAAAVGFDQRIRHCILINTTVCGYLSAVPGSAHELNASVLQAGINGCEDTRVVAAAKIDTYGILSGSADFCDILLQSLDVFYRHDRHLLKHVCRCADIVEKCNYADAVFRDIGIVAHANAADTGNAGKPLLQLLYVGLKLRVIGKQHNKLGIS